MASLRQLGRTAAFFPVDLIPEAMGRTDRVSCGTVHVQDVSIRRWTKRQKRERNSSLSTQAVATLASMRNPLSAWVHGASSHRARLYLDKIWGSLTLDFRTDFCRKGPNDRQLSVSSKGKGEIHTEKRKRRLNRHWKPRTTLELGLRGSVLPSRYNRRRARRWIHEKVPKPRNPLHTRSQRKPGVQVERQETLDIVWGAT